MISKGTIYKIVCKLNDIVYVGSTFKTLSKRWYVHKHHYKDWLNGKSRKCSIYDSFKKYGIENFKIIEIKKYDVYREYYKDYKHLQSKEQLWINKLKCVNSNCSFNPIPENEYKKYYRLNNKDKIKERKKEYHITNKDKIKEQRKIKITCECGSIYRKCDKARHERTNKHMNYINN